MTPQTDFLFAMIAAVMIAYLFPFLLIFWNKKNQVRRFKAELWQQSKNAIEDGHNRDYIVESFYIGPNKFYVASATAAENAEKIKLAAETHERIANLTINIL